MGRPGPLLRQALVLVQADLDATGLDAIRTSFAVAGGTDDDPVVNVQWSGTWTSDGLDVNADNQDHVTVDVARQLAQRLVELDGVYWPTCPKHRRRTTATVNARGRAVWWCDVRGVTPHDLGPIGSLADRRDRNARWWRTLADLPAP